MKILRFGKRTKADILSDIRGHFMSLGYDMSQFTDEQIEIGLLEFSRVYARSGITVAEAMQAMKTVANTIHVFPDP